MSLDTAIEYLNSIHNFFEECWSQIFALFGNDEKLIFTVGTSLVLFLSFCWINLMFMYLDLTGRPKFLLKYKVQKDKNVPVDPKRYMNCVFVSLTNEILTCVLVVLLYPIMRNQGMSCQRHLPSIWKFFLDYFIYLVLDEILFYYSHRLLHTPFFYKRIHKKHHEWIAPISIAASYSHPLEHIISNTLTKLIGPIVMGSHLSTAWIWFMTGQIDTCIHHSNYHFPFLSSPQFHDYHHAKFNENFGVTGWLDRFHSTDVNYQKSIQMKRHMTFYQIEPITNMFPSDKEKEN